MIAATVSCSLLGVELDALDRGSPAPTLGDAGGDANAPDAPGEETTTVDSGDGKDAARGCTGERGPLPVRVGDAGFCIDSTEVTQTQYQQFRAAFLTGTKLEQPSYCAFNSDIQPKYGFSLSGEKPVRAVDFCDAYAFCRWAGKRLCQNPGNAPLSEWAHTCTSGGLLGYPYGASYVPTACAGKDNPQPDASSGLSFEVGTLPSCEGPKGVFDLSGNLQEWEDDGYEADGGRVAYLRGGSFAEPGGALSCAAKSAASVTDRRDFAGIRCCSDWLD